jgi:hypothetical protein
VDRSARARVNGEVEEMWGGLKGRRRFRSARARGRGSAAPSGWGDNLLPLPQRTRVRDTVDATDECAVAKMSFVRGPFLPPSSTFPPRELHAHAALAAYPPSQEVQRDYPHLLSRASRARPLRGSHESASCRLRGPFPPAPTPPTPCRPCPARPLRLPRQSRQLGCRSQALPTLGLPSWTSFARSGGASHAAAAFCCPTPRDAPRGRRRTPRCRT